MKKIGLETLLEYKFISNLRYSKENNLLAFILKNSNLEENKYDSYIYTYDLKSKNLKKMTAIGEENSFEFHGDSILFPGNREKEDKDLAEKGFSATHFYRLALDGGEAQKAFTVPLEVFDYEWLDDENIILLGCVNEKLPSLMDFKKLKDENKEKAMAEAAKTIKDEKGFERLGEIPFWMNGRGFTDGKRTRLYKFNTNDESITQISPKNADVYFFKLTDKKIFYIYSTAKGKVELFNTVGEISLDGFKSKKLFSKKDYSFFYADELEGEIFLIGKDLRNIGLNSNPDFYILKDKDLKIITPEDFDYSICSSVNSDARLGGNKNLEKIGDRIYFTSTQRVNTYLFSIGVSGDIKKEIDLPGAIDGFAMDEKDIFTVAFRGNKLQEIYSYKNKKETKLTGFNDSIMEEYEISAPEYVEVDRGDFSLDGYIMRPIGFKEGKKYKTILQIHGGPKTVYGSIFYSEMQYLAALGYVVIYTNPRGSDGRGNEFSDIRGKYGTIDYDDIMAFTKEMVKRYDFIDEKNIGVTGGSYGGYMTNWIVGHTDYFKAAVTQRSISNWISKFNTTDIGYYFVKDQVGATPWEDFQKLWDNSPLKYADKVKTPTLVIHSEDDFRCDVDQGYQFFTALKYHGVETGMLLVRGENHDLSRSGKPKQRIERLKAISDWFEKYI